MNPAIAFTHILINKKDTLKRILILGTILSFILSTVVAGYSFHCGKFGKNLARKGMHKHQILKDCGPPFSKEIV